MPSRGRSRSPRLSVIRRCQGAEVACRRATKRCRFSRARNSCQWTLVFSSDHATPAPDGRQQLVARHRFDDVGGHRGTQRFRRWDPPAAARKNDRRRGIQLSNHNP